MDVIIIPSETKNISPLMVGRPAMRMDGGGGEMDIFLAILSNFNPQACLIPISPIGLQQRHSN